MDEKGNESVFPMVDLVGAEETLTTLEINATTETLDYTYEKENVTFLDLTDAVKEPWYNSATNSAVTSNTHDIYTQGWVEIGYTTPSGTANEKLRVNVPITTQSSYYADYVFEDYFEGSSMIKPEYNFKSLEDISAIVGQGQGILTIYMSEKTIPDASLEGPTHTDPVIVRWDETVQIW